jgi:D-glycero-beta-D-manno-heptose-7-phosphate kinase
MINFNNMKVLVIGDICLDIIEEGQSHRMSPEAPVPVILNPKENYTLGMAGNVALNLKNLGADVSLSTGYVSDESGNKIYSLLKENDLIKERRFVQNINSKNACTTTKKRIFSNNQQVARLDYETTIHQVDMKELISISLKTRIDLGEQYDFIIIADYDKGVITEYTWPSILENLEILLKEDGEFFVDTKKKNILSFYEGMNIFPNTKEMNELLEYNNCSTRNELRREMDLPFIIETAGENGAFIYSDNKVLSSKAYKNGVIDVCGCGDTFVAAFSLFYSKFGSKLKALDFANYCSSKVGQKKGTSSVYLHEVLDFKGWD